MFNNSYGSPIVFNLLVMAPKTAMEFTTKSPRGEWYCHCQPMFPWEVFKRLKLVGRFGVTTGRSYCGVRAQERRLGVNALTVVPQNSKMSCDSPFFGEQQCRLQFFMLRFKLRCVAVPSAWNTRCPSCKWHGVRRWCLLCVVTCLPRTY